MPAPRTPKERRLSDKNNYPLGPVGPEGRARPAVITSAVVVAIVLYLVFLKPEVYQ